MAVHDGHRKRLRERAAKTGLEGFQPHEVVELLLTFTIPRKDVNELGHALVDRFGSFAGAADATREELMAVKGIGENSATLLSLLPQIVAYYQKDRWGEKPQLENRRKAGEFCTAMFARQRVESLVLVCLDAHKQVLAAETLTQGTVDEAPVYTRAVVECALRHHAQSVLLAHNHPSGIITPSEGDVAVSQQIKRALETVEVELLDHIVVAGSEFASLTDLGLMGRQRSPILPFDRAADNDDP
jgi:DNA repair protein RadC